jgi:prophage regulatory protein
MDMKPLDRFLRLNTVLERTGLSRATLYRKIQSGTFPKQVRIAERCCGWREDLFQKRCTSRRNARRKPAICSIRRHPNFKPRSKLIGRLAYSNSLPRKMTA